LFSFFKELRLMVFSVLKSGKTLCWSFMLMLITIYVFGVYLLDNVAIYLHTIDTTELSKKDLMTINMLRLRFGSMLQTFYTLFAAVTGGIDWSDIADGLLKVGWPTAAMMIFFVFFMAFAMMNVITAIFVESAYESVYNDHDEIIHDELTAESTTLKKLRGIFERIDQSRAGSLSLKDFEEALENPETLLLLRRLGVNVTAAHGLFRLLDLDNSGSVSAREFLVGCMKLRGGAKAVDLATLMYENKRMMLVWSKFFKYVKHELERFRTFERTLVQNSVARAEVMPQHETCCDSSGALKAQL